MEPFVRELLVSFWPHASWTSCTVVVRDTRGAARWDRDCIRSGLPVGRFELRGLTDVELVHKLAVELAIASTPPPPQAVPAPPLGDMGELENVPLPGL